MERCGRRGHGAQCMDGNLGWRICEEAMGKTANLQAVCVDINMKIFYKIIPH